MEDVSNIVRQFSFDGIYIDAIPYGDGHINETFLVECDEDGTRNRYILQKMNPQVARDPELLMENMLQVTRYMQRQMEGNPDGKIMLQLVLSADGKPCYRSKSGDYYRAFHFIEHAISYDVPQSPEHMKECGRILGWFEKTLAEFVFEPEYVEMTKNFHNTIHRYEMFLEAVNRDDLGRVKEVTEEIQFFIEHKNKMEHLLTLAGEGEIPFRATHNDLRLSNIMLDKATGKAAALVDLDTVMPGLAAYDYGDAIRSAAKRIYKENGQIVKVELDLDVAREFTKGYLESAEEFLTESEIATLPYGILTMSLELGMRYLTDYLDGDLYFVKNKNGENRLNARREMLLATEIEAAFEDLLQMVQISSLR